MTDEDKVFVDPTLLRQFSDKFRYTSDDFEQQILNIENALARLGRSWKDDEFSEFDREFKKASAGVKELVQESRKVNQAIIGDIERAEVYQKQKLR